VPNKEVASQLDIRILKHLASSMLNKSPIVPNLVKVQNNHHFIDKELITNKIRYNEFKNSKDKNSLYELAMNLEFSKFGNVVVPFYFQVGILKENKLINIFYFLYPSMTKHLFRLINIVFGLTQITPITFRHMLIRNPVNNFLIEYLLEYNDFLQLVKTIKFTNVINYNMSDYDYLLYSRISKDIQIKNIFAMLGNKISQKGGSSEISQIQNAKFQFKIIKMRPIIKKINSLYIINLSNIDYNCIDIANKKNLNIKCQGSIVLDFKHQKYATSKNAELSSSITSILHQLTQPVLLQNILSLPPKLLYNCCLNNDSELTFPEIHNVFINVAKILKPKLNNTKHNISVKNFQYDKELEKNLPV
jgi:hypothetical protein